MIGKEPKIMDDQINFYALWETALNGGAPVTDFDDIKHWAENLLRVNHDND